MTGRHRAPSLLGPTVITALIVVAALALLWWLVPELPAEPVYVRDVRTPVPMPGPSYLPTPPTTSGPSR